MQRILVPASVVLAAASVVLLASSARAALIASDNASDAAYGTGWSNGQNGGSGFNPWAISGNSGNANTSFYGAFIGDSTTNGGAGTGATNSSGGINTTGSKAWALYANTSNTENAVRSFKVDSNGNSALTTRQKVSFAMDNGFVANGASVGVGLQTTGGTNRLELFFGGGSTTYSLRDNSGVVNTTVPYTDAGLNVVMTLTSVNTYSITISPNGGTAKTLTGTLIGAPGTADIGQFRAFNFNAGSGGGPNFFVNSLSITKDTLSLTNAAPAGYGSQVGSLTVTGSNGNYNPAFLTGLSGNSGYVAVNGFSPVSNTEIFAFSVLVNGTLATPSQISQLVAALGVNATAISPTTAFGSQYNLFVNYSGTALPGGAQPYYIGYDFSTATQALGNVTIAAVAVIPEPSLATAVLLAAMPLVARRRR